MANQSYGTNGQGHTYTVTLTLDGVPSSCTCPHNTFHGALCKHMVYVARQHLVCASAAALQATPIAQADGGEMRTDGGRVNAEAEAEIAPDCSGCEPGSPCWPCYRDDKRDFSSSGDDRADAGIEPERATELKAEQ